MDCIAGHPHRAAFMHSLRSKGRQGNACHANQRSLRDCIGIGSARCIKSFRGIFDALCRYFSTAAMTTSGNRNQSTRRNFCAPVSSIHDTPGHTQAFGRRCCCPLHNIRGRSPTQQRRSRSQPARCIAVRLVHVKFSALHRQLVSIRPASVIAHCTFLQRFASGIERYAIQHLRGFGGGLCQLAGG